MYRRVKLFFFCFYFNFDIQHWSDLPIAPSVSQSDLFNLIRSILAGSCGVESGAVRIVPLPSSLVEMVVDGWGNFYLF